MSTQQLKFGDPVEWKGRPATIVGIKGDVVDLLLVRELKDGAGKTKNVVGTAQQVELVNFEHDVPIAEIEGSEDWFFSLSNDQLDALVKERERRNHEKAQAEQAAVAEALQKSTLEGVKIRPNDKVLAIAEKLWKDAVRAEQHAGDHDEIELPKFDKQPEAWKPWIEKAKGFIAKEAEKPVQAETAGQQIN